MAEEIIAFGSTSDRLDDLSDADFLRGVSWRKSAGKRLVNAAANGDVSAFATALRRTYAQSRQSQDRSKNSPMPALLRPLWSQHAWDDPPTTSRLNALLTDLRHLQKKHGSKASRRASQLVRDGLEAASVDTSPWSLLVWMTVLVTTADLLDDRTLVNLWRASLVAAATHSTSDHNKRVSENVDFADDRQLLLTGELPWVGGIVFSPVKGAARLQRQGKRDLRTQLEALTDSDGTPHSRTLHRLPLMLAVFTRSLAIGKALGEKLFDKASADRFRRLVGRAALMTHADGRLALSNGASFATSSLMQAASSLAGLTTQHAAGRRVIGLPDDVLSSMTSRRNTSQRRRPEVKRKQSRKIKQLPSTQSDWAELACMRNNWSEGGDSCIIAHHGVFPQLSVTGFERLLIDGDWQLAVEVDGTSVEVKADWECVCWFSDEDADYVELQQETEDGVTLLRQALLSRTDHWLWLADNARVSPDSTRDNVSIRLRSEMPLAGGPRIKENRWTRDVAFQTDRLKWHAYPLGLAEERVHKTNGSLTTEDGRIVLEQTSAGSGLFMPLLLDWSPDRRRDASQWRQLTIAEDGQRLPPHVACGQRLRIGKHQWLFYRSHQPGETGRSVLGHHTLQETVIAEFTSDGEVEPIVLVE